MAIGVEEVLRTRWAAGGMKLFLVEHERDLVRIKVHAEDLQMVGVLAIEQIVPGVTGARLVEKAVVVGRALEDLWIAEVIGQNLVRAGQVVGQSEGFVAHEGETVVVFLDVKLQGDADLVQVAQTSGPAPGFLGACQGWEHQTRQQSDYGKHKQQLDEGEGKRKSEILPQGGTKSETNPSAELGRLLPRVKPVSRATAE